MDRAEGECSRTLCRYNPPAGADIPWPASARSPRGPAAAQQKPLDFLHVSFLPTSDYLGTVGCMDALEATGKDTKSQENTACDGDALPRRFERYTLLKRIARGGMGEV